MDKPRNSLLAVLAYPLHLESLSVIVLFSICVAIYGLAYVSATLIPLPPYGSFLSLIASSSLLGLFFEYGLTILEHSALKKEVPPAFSYQLIQRNRFGRQIVFTAILVAIVQNLYFRDVQFFATFLACSFIAFFPAMLVSNALYKGIEHMINPIVLSGIAWHLGWKYIGATLLSLVIALATIALFDLGLYFFLMATPVLLYCILLVFRWLGLSCADVPEFVVTKSNQPDSAHKTNTMHASRDALNNQLRQIRDLRKTRGRKAALKRLHAVASYNNWLRFELVFDTVSSWEDKKLATEIVRGYLSQLQELNNPMRAFELIKWCQLWDEKFHFHEIDLLVWLDSHACTPQHHLSLIQLFHHVVTQSDQHNTIEHIRNLGREILFTKLDGADREKLQNNNHFREILVSFD